ncbi:MAG TPA: VWA domain-containing protein [Polyangium sp.]|nr:VWA domain-containing protein [Polyangium sp.]
MKASSRRAGAGFSFGRSVVSMVLTSMTLLGLAVFGQSCSSGTEGAPCDTVYAGKCGAVCASDNTCPAGQYCGLSGSCTADCAAGAAQCTGSQVCNGNGKCVDGSGNGGSGGEGGGFIGVGSTGSGMDPDAGCADVVVNFSKQIPTVMLLLDQSGSMTQAFSNTDRWNALYQTLMNNNDGIVKTLENEVRFGLALYTSIDGNAGGTCPMLKKVPIALGNYSAIDAVYSPEVPQDETPTGESVDAVAQDLIAFKEMGPKIIVLATDGEPDTCAVPNPQMGQAESVASVQNAYKQGIKTYVISVGSEVSDMHLQDVANAGVGLAIGGADKAPFYKALDQAALVAAFDTIINGVRSCTLQLNGTVDQSGAASGKVSLDGTLLTYNDPNGWRLVSPTEIELLGTACQTIKSGDHTLSVQFPCGIVVPN